MSLWKLLNGRWGSGAGETDEIRIDGSTNGLIGITYAHHEIHSGSSFTAVDLRSVSTTTFKWQITTPDSLVYAHILFDIECTGEMTLLVTEGSDRTNGTAVPAINRNRVGTPSAATVVVTHTPTSGTTDGATTIMNKRIGATGVGNKTLTAGGVRGANEFVLKPNTKYVVSATTYAAVYVSLGLDWYEHTDKH